MSWGAREVTVRFGRRTALDDVSLDAPAGQVTAVVGGDGAGKTTLLRALAGALGVSAGTVRRPPARRLGYLPASSGTYPDLSVDENLAFTASAFRLGRDEARRRSDDLLERTGLAGARDRLAGHLSGGMRQKLGVIRALLPGPDLVILDEPTTGIDPVSRADLWWLVARAAAGGAAVVLATTTLDEAERATQVVVLDDGRVLAAGSPERIVASVPGAIRPVDARPDGEAGRRAWRRRGRWRLWDPDAAADDALAPDLQDAVTVRALQREHERPS